MLAAAAPHGYAMGLALGIAEIPVMVAAGWSEAQKRAYVLADNQLAITGSGWERQHFPSVARARACARGGRKSKTVAGRQGRAVGDRSADPVREKCSPTALPERSAAEHSARFRTMIAPIGVRRGRSSRATSRMSGTARCTSARSRNLYWPPDSWSAATWSGRSPRW